MGREPLENAGSSPGVPRLFALAGACSRQRRREAALPLACRRRRGERTCRYPGRVEVDHKVDDDHRCHPGRRRRIRAGADCQVGLRDQIKGVSALLSACAAVFALMLVQESTLVLAMVGRSCAASAGSRRCRTLSASSGRACSLWSAWLADPRSMPSPCDGACRLSGAVGCTYTPRELRA